MKPRIPRGRPAHNDVLTPTEWRVVHAVQHGMTNREIATRRGVSLDAVKYHVANAFAKLGVGSRRSLRQCFHAPKGSALDTRENQVTASPPFGRLCQISRTVNDIKQSQHGTRRSLGSGISTRLVHLRSLTAGARG